MKSFSDSDIIFYCLISFVLAFFISNRFFRGDPAGWKQIITSDGRGYYAYLPALLIDHDLTYKRVIEREKAILGFPVYQPSYLVKNGNSVMNKYFAGEALLLLPFFLLSMLITFLTGADMNGYSVFFQVFTGIGALFYLFLGLHYLKKIMQYLEMRPPVISFVLITILLGTNLLYYSVWQPSMSHVYSFFATNGFLWFTCRAVHLFSTKRMAVAGFFFGIVVLIRPTNGVILLLIPFLFRDFDSMKHFGKSFIKNRLALFLFLVIPVLVFSIQLFLWYLQTGHFFIWSYRDEGFFFLHPEVRNVLISFRKGLFVYTPLVFLAVPGLMMTIRYPIKFISMLVFLIISTYLIASWWNWYYGDSFGLRTFIDYYGVFGILTGYLMDRIPLKRGSLILALLAIPFIFLNFFQTWQYANHIIHPNSMNRAKYRYVFLKSDSTYFNCLGGLREMAGYSVDKLHPAMVTVNDFEKPVEHWYSPYIRIYSNAKSGKQVNHLDSLNIYSSGFFIRADRISAIPAKFFVEGSFSVYDSIPGASNMAKLVFSMDSINLRENYWQGFRLNDIPENPARTWRICHFSFTLPRFLYPERILKVYIWNFGKKPFLIDDFKMTFYIDKAGRDLN